MRGCDVGVVRYGAGNLGNVLRALRSLELRHSLLENPGDMSHLGAPALLLLPGVGAFPPAMAALAASGWAGALEKWARAARPLLGICLGMQLLCTESGEDGRTRGLGLIEGNVERLAGVPKVPHMGWNRVRWTDEAWANTPEQEFYFVHSYAVMNSPHCVGCTDVDGVSFCSALRCGNVAGFQFHPERSGPEGVAFLGRALRFMIGEYSNPAKGAL